MTASSIVPKLSANRYVQLQMLKVVVVLFGC